MGRRRAVTAPSLPYLSMATKNKERERERWIKADTQDHLLKTDGRERVARILLEEINLLWRGVNF